MFVDQYTPTSYKEWYSKDGVAKAASFREFSLIYVGIYIKLGTTYHLAAKVLQDTEEAADRYAIDYITRYDKALAAQSTDSQDDQTSL